MCSHLFGKSSGQVEGLIGDVVGGLVGDYYGGPVGAAVGAEAGGTLGGVAGGEKVGQAALNALPAAGVAGVGAYGAEALGSSFGGSGGSDWLGVSGYSGTPAAPSPVSAGGFGSNLAQSGDAFALNDPGTNGYIDPQTGLPVPPTPPAQAPLPGAMAGGTGASGSPVYTAIGSPTYTDPNATSADPNNSNNVQPGTLAHIADTLGISKSSILPAGVAGIGLARSLLSPSALQGQPQLNSQAQQLAQQSQLMQSYLQTGQLPPGVKTAIDNATAGAKASIRAKYAQMGIPGSSAEQQELQQVELNAAAQGAQLAINLYTMGTQDADISAHIYQTLLSTDVQQQEMTGNAIANMAAALSGQGGAYQRSFQQQPRAV